MASGIAVAPECVEEFNTMKMRKDIPYIIFVIDKDGKNIIVEEKADATKTFENLTQVLAKKEEDGKCCWALADVPVEGIAGQEDVKLTLINWFPDTGHIKQKMIYSASTKAFHASLGRGFKTVQANDLGDLELKYIQQKIK